MPLDVLNEIDEAKQTIDPSNEQLLENLNGIQERAKASAESMDVLRTIVSGLTEGGNDLSKSLEKVVYYFERFEQKSESAKKSVFGLGSAYSSIGQDSPAQIKKIVNALTEVEEIQTSLGKGVRFSALDNVSLLTKEVAKLRNVLKDMPGIPSASNAVAGKFANGGEIPGSHTTGDKVPIMVNSGEYVLNRNQMKKLGSLISPKGLSPREVFQRASGRSSESPLAYRRFASGGLVDAIEEESKNNYSTITNSDQRKQLASLAKVIRKNEKSLVESIIGVNLNDRSLLASYIISNISQIGNWIKGIQDAYIGHRRGEASNRRSYRGVMGNSLNAISNQMGIESDISRHTIGRENTSASNKVRAEKSLLGHIKSGNNSNDRRIQERQQQILRSHGADTESGMNNFLEHASADEIEDLNDELEETLDLLTDMEKEVADLEGVRKKFEDNSDDMIKKFSSWLGGTPVGLAAVATGIAIVSAGVAKLADMVNGLISDTAKLSLNTALLNSQMKAFGSSIDMKGLREELNLTREQALQLGDAFMSSGSMGVSYMDAVAKMASNMKDYLGAVDISALREASELIKGLPKEQVDVLINGTGTFDDKASLIANLIEGGNLDRTIDLMTKGTFGQQDGMAQLSEKDRMMIETMNKTNKFVEDIKMGLYDWMPEWLGKSSIWGNTFVKLAATAMGVVAPFLIGMNALRKLGGAAIPGAVRTHEVGRGVSVPSSGRGRFGLSGRMRLWSRQLGAMGRSPSAGRLGGSILRGTSSSLRGISNLIKPSGVIGRGLGGITRLLGGIGGKLGALAGPYGAIAAAAVAVSAAVGVATGLITKGIFKIIEGKKREQAKKWEHDENVKDRNIYGHEFAHINEYEAEAEGVKRAGNVAAWGAGLTAATAILAPYLAPLVGLGTAIASLSQYFVGKEKSIKEQTGGEASYMYKDNKKYSGSGSGWDAWNPKNWNWKTLFGGLGGIISDATGLSEWLFGKRVFTENKREKDPVSEKIKELADKFDKQNQELFRQVTGKTGKEIEKDMLKSLIAVNRHVKNIDLIVSGKKAGFDNKMVKAYESNLKSINLVGGSDKNFKASMEGREKHASMAYDTEMKALNRRRQSIMNDNSLDAEGRVNALAHLQEKEVEIHQRYYDSMLATVGNLEKIPSVMLSSIKSAIDSSLQDFYNSNMVGSGNIGNQNNKALVQDYYKMLDEGGEQLKRIKAESARAEKRYKDESEKYEQYRSSKGFSSEEDVDATVQEYRTKMEKARDDNPGLFDTQETLENLYGKAKANFDAAMKDPTKKASVEEAQAIKESLDEEMPKVLKELRRQGRNAEADELEKAYKNFKIDQKDPQATNNRAMLVLEAMNKANKGLTLAAEKQAGISADLSKKYRDARSVQGAKTAVTGADNARKVAADREKKIYDSIIENLSKKAQEMAANMRRTFEDGSYLFAKRIEEVLKDRKGFSTMTKGSERTQREIVAAELETEKTLWKNADNAKAVLDDMLTNGTFKEMAKEANKDKDVTGYTFNAEEKRYRQLAAKREELRAKVAANPNDVQSKVELDRLNGIIASLEKSQTIKNYQTTESFRIFNAALSSAAAVANQYADGVSKAQKTTENLWKTLPDKVMSMLDDVKYKILQSEADLMKSRMNMLEAMGNYSGAGNESAKYASKATQSAWTNISGIEKGRDLALETLQKLWDTGKITDVRIFEERKQAIIAESNKKILEEYNRLAENIKHSMDFAEGSNKRRKEMVDINKDVAQSLGLPFEYIVQLEQQTVQLAKEYAEIERIRLERMEKAGVKGPQLEEQKLKYAKAQAEAIKASFGAQRDAIDKMLAKAMGAFTQMGGIFGPNGSRMFAAKYGQGYMMNNVGMIHRPAGMGFNQRNAYVNQGGNYQTPGNHTGFNFPFSFAQGGELNNKDKRYTGKIHSDRKSGDKNILRTPSGQEFYVNGDEYILNQEQMSKLAKGLGYGSNDDVFNYADGKKFAKGGQLNKKPFTIPYIEQLKKQMEELRRMMKNAKAPSFKQTPSDTEFKPFSVQRLPKLKFASLDDLLGFNIAERQKQEAEEDALFMKKMQGPQKADFTDFSRFHVDENGALLKNNGKNVERRYDAGGRVNPSDTKRYNKAQARRKYKNGSDGFKGKVRGMDYMTVDDALHFDAQRKEEYAKQFDYDEFSSDKERKGYYAAKERYENRQQAEAFEKYNAKLVAPAGKPGDWKKSSGGQYISSVPTPQDTKTVGGKYLSGSANYSDASRYLGRHAIGQSMTTDEQLNSQFGAEVAAANQEQQKILGQTKHQTNMSLNGAIGGKANGDCGDYSDILKKILKNTDKILALMEKKTIGEDGNKSNKVQAVQRENENATNGDLNSYGFLNVTPKLMEEKKTLDDLSVKGSLTDEQDSRLGDIENSIALSKFLKTNGPDGGISGSTEQQADWGQLREATKNEHDALNKILYWVKKIYLAVMKCCGKPCKGGSGNGVQVNVNVKNKAKDTKSEGAEKTDTPKSSSSGASFGRALLGGGGIGLMTAAGKLSGKTDWKGMASGAWKKIKSLGSKAWEKTKAFGSKVKDKWNNSRLGKWTNDKISRIKTGYKLGRIGGDVNANDTWYEKAAIKTGRAVTKIKDKWNGAKANFNRKVFGKVSPEELHYQQWQANHRTTGRNHNISQEAIERFNKSNSLWGKTKAFGRKMTAPFKNAWKDFKTGYKFARGGHRLEDLSLKNAKGFGANLANKTGKFVKGTVDFGKSLPGRVTALKNNVSAWGKNIKANFDAGRLAGKYDLVKPGMKADGFGANFANKAGKFVKSSTEGGRNAFRSFKAGLKGHKIPNLNNRVMPQTPFAQPVGNSTDFLSKMSKGDLRRYNLSKNLYEHANTGAGERAAAKAAMDRLQAKYQPQQVSASVKPPVVQKPLATRPQPSVINRAANWTGRQFNKMGRAFDAGKAGHGFASTAKPSMAMRTANFMGKAAKGSSELTRAFNVGKGGHGFLKGSNPSFMMKTANLAGQGVNLSAKGLQTAVDATSKALKPLASTASRAIQPMANFGKGLLNTGKNLNAGFGKFMMNPKVGAGMKVLGAVGTTLAVAQGGMEAYSKFSAGDKRGGTQAITGTAGGLAMAAAGAKGGALLGTMIGGPIGTVLGGLAGGALGYMAGDRLGRWAGGQAYDAVTGEKKADAPSFGEALFGVGEAQEQAKYIDDFHNQTMSVNKDVRAWTKSMQEAGVVTEDEIAAIRKKARASDRVKQAGDRAEADAKQAMGHEERTGWASKAWGWVKDNTVDAGNPNDLKAKQAQVARGDAQLAEENRIVAEEVEKLRQKKIAEMKAKEKANNEQIVSHQASYNAETQAFNKEQAVRGESYRNFAKSANTELNGMAEGVKAVGDKYGYNSKQFKQVQESFVKRQTELQEEAKRRQQEAADAEKKFLERREQTYQIKDKEGKTQTITGTEYDRRKAKGEDMSGAQRVERNSKGEYVAVRNEDTKQKFVQIDGKEYDMEDETQRAEAEKLQKAKADETAASRADAQELYDRRKATALAGNDSAVASLEKQVKEAQVPEQRAALEKALKQAKAEREQASAQFDREHQADMQEVEYTDLQGKSHRVMKNDQSFVTAQQQAQAQGKQLQVKEIPLPELPQQQAVVTSGQQALQQIHQAQAQVQMPNGQQMRQQTPESALVGTRNVESKDATKTALDVAKGRDYRASGQQGGANGSAPDGGMGGNGGGNGGKITVDVNIHCDASWIKAEVKKIASEMAPQIVQQGLTSSSKG